MILAASAAALVLLVLLGVFLWRRRRSRRSRFGFKAAPAATAEASPFGPGRDGNSRSATEQFVARRGQRIADVLVDYAKAKNLPSGSVYCAWLWPDACVWWIGEKFPSHPKAVIAAVHAGLRPRRGFRSKVVVLKDAAEVDALARALGRAAKSKFPPVRHDAWSMPIAFEGFPLRPGDNHAIVDVMDSIAPPQGKR